MTFKIVSREEWIEARKILLEKEKAHTAAGDALLSERRQLPVVKIDKDYTFTSSTSSTPHTLLDLFEGRKQLIIYHFMLGPDDTEGCPGCSFLADNFPKYLQHLHSRETTLAMVSRAPMEKIEAFKKRMGWEVPWYSSSGTDFNYHFHATNDEKIAPVLSNWQDKKTLEEKGKTLPTSGEQPGMSVFVRCPENTVYHTYSAYERGLDSLLVTNSLLDTTRFGRQDALPKGMKAAEWLHHDKYEAKAIET